MLTRRGASTSVAASALDGRQPGVRLDPTAPGVAGRIVKMIVAARRKVGVERDDAGGEAFLNRLGADPTAKL
jgi:hypothetical protein